MRQEIVTHKLGFSNLPPKEILRHKPRKNHLKKTVAEEVFVAESNPIQKLAQDKQIT